LLLTRLPVFTFICVDCLRLANVVLRLACAYFTFAAPT
jgi:hypothetical protein